MMFNLRLRDKGHGLAPLAKGMTKYHIFSRMLQTGFPSQMTLVNDGSFVDAEVQAWKVFRRSVINDPGVHIKPTGQVVGQCPGE